MNVNNRLEMFLTLNAGAFKKGLSSAGAGLHNFSSSVSTTASRIATMVAPITALVSVVGGLNKLVDVTREFDKLSAGLITATGSAAGAKAAFAAIQDFAARTPYDLAQVTDSFVKLVNFGLNPSERAMASYGNTASALGKDLNQMIEAVADAATGEFERLKEFGIKASSEGDKVSFTFRGITTTVGKNAKEIEDYLINLGETNFGDAMANRMKTLDGALSNLGDEWDKLFLNISQKGIGDAIAKGVRTGIAALEELNAMIVSGEMDGYLKAYAGKWSAWAEDVKNSIRLVSEYFAGETDGMKTRGTDTVTFLIDAFRNFPENVRAFIGILTVEMASGFDRLKADAKAFKDSVAAIFTSSTLDEVEAERLRQLEIIRQAREESIAAILEERDTAIQSADEQTEAAKRLRKEYEDIRDAAKGAGDELRRASGGHDQPQPAPAPTSSKPEPTIRRPAPAQRPELPPQEKESGAFVNNNGTWEQEAPTRSAQPVGKKEQPKAAPREKFVNNNGTWEQEQPQVVVDDTNAKLTPEELEAKKQERRAKLQQAEAELDAVDPRQGKDQLKSMMPDMQPVGSVGGKDDREPAEPTEEAAAEYFEELENKKKARREAAAAEEQEAADKAAREEEERAEQAEREEEEREKKREERASRRRDRSGDGGEWQKSLDAAKSYEERMQQVAETVAESGRQAAAEWADAQAAGAEKAKSVFQQYTDKVKSLQLDIAGREKALAEELDGLDNRGTAETKWRRKAKEAKEYEKAARAAMQAGNLDEALKLSDQAKAAYSGLKGGAGSISDKLGDQAALRGVKASGTLGIDISKAVQQATAKSALTAMPGSDLFGDLSARIRGQLAAVAGGGADKGPAKADGPAKVHELKFAGGSMRGGEADVEALLNLLAQAGMSAG